MEIKINKDINRDFFFCYSNQLSKFLHSKGIGYITIARDVHSEKIFSLYPKNMELRTALDEYKRINN